MNTTIADIAKLAGVAKSTVSRYLNGGYVSDTTKAKIEKIIEETGFEPNSFAQSLKAKKTNFVGVIVPRLDSYATSRTLIGIDETLRGRNYQMLISNTSQSLERELESIYSLARQKVAGIILLATEITEKHLQIFKEVKLPILIVGQECEGYHCLIHDDYHAGYEMGNYVIQQGHRDIVYIGVPEKDIAVGVKRKEGFKEAVSKHSHCNVIYCESSFKIEEATEKAYEIIEKHQPSVVVCATDNIALGAMKAIYAHGYSIPSEISITGFGGYDVTGIVHPGLTTIKFHYKTAGHMAADKMVKLIEGAEVERMTVSSYELIERESVEKKS